MRRSKLNDKKVLSISLVILFAVTIILILYYNYKIQELNNNFNAKISAMNKDLKDLEEGMSSLRDDLILGIEMIDNNLKSFKKQNQEEIETLNTLIDEIEQQSNIKLDALQEELKNIKVDSKDFTAIIGDVIQSVVSVGTNKGQGSGFVFWFRGF